MIIIIVQHLSSEAALYRTGSEWKFPKTQQGSPSPREVTALGLLILED